MEAELAELAATGATTLVGLMVSDAWGQARARIAAFFARAGGDAGHTEDQLQSARAALVRAQNAGDEDAAAVSAGVEDDWRARLRDLLRTEPAAAEELRGLLAEWGPRAAGGPVTVVHNSVSGGVQHGPVVQGRDFGSITFSGAVTPAPHDPPPPPPAG